MIYPTPLFRLLHSFITLPIYVEDVIARRTRLAFLSKVAALRAVPRVVALMAGELGWDDSRQKLEVLRCVRFMNHFGGPEPAAQQKAAPGGATGDLAAARVRMVLALMLVLEI